MREERSFDVDIKASLAEVSDSTTLSITILTP
jgi:hypothetical protein